MADKINWTEAFKPLLKKYKGKKHPLDYGNTYQLLVMVVLSAQSTDRLINDMAPKFFATYPNIESLSKANANDLFPLLKIVRGFGKKAKWLTDIAKKIKKDKNIPSTMDELTALSGIGRKSANVIMREAGKKAEGIIVDLHVVRVAPRIGIAKGEDPKKIEKQIMEAIPQKGWGEIGMAISFLGRETCRPTKPNCPDCVMNKHCEYYKAGN